MTRITHWLFILAMACTASSGADTIVLKAAHYFDVDAGKLVSPAEILIDGERIAEIGTVVAHPTGARFINLGSRTLMPGLIDAHVHLFLHPGAEDLQTVQESIPARTIVALHAAREDVLAGFTAERDMGSEGAASADSAVRDAINSGLYPGPRLRVSGNAIDILGGHEDAIAYNPGAHVPSNADYANTADDLVRVMRQQHKEGADFAKIYQTGPDEIHNGTLHTSYQYTVAQLKAAVEEATRMGTTVAVHATGEPATGYAAQAGVASIDHAHQLSDATMELMKKKKIFAVPTLAWYEYFTSHSANDAANTSAKQMYQYKIKEFKKQVKADIPFAVGSDVGPFQHGTQARELELMVQYGMTPIAVLQADLLNGAQLLGWSSDIGQLKAGYYADIIAVDENPLIDIAALEKVSFVMKGGAVVREATQ
jgi:imidazolonepropionase-like amidohydrolase